MIARLAIMLLSAGLFGCSDQRPELAHRFAALPAESPTELRSEMQALCDAITASDDPYYGRAQIAELESYLDRPSADPRGPIVVRARLGSELLRVGRTEEAITRLSEALVLAEAAGLEAPLVADLRRRAAIAELRNAESLNCIAMHGPQSCIFPLSDEARHANPAAAGRALAHYEALFASGIRSPVAAWLANIASMAVGSFPEALPPELRVDARWLDATASAPRMRDVAAERGIRNVKASGGALIDDFDGDGWPEIVTSTIDPCESMELWRNLGDGSFEQGTATAGLDLQFGGLNVLHADIDNDGDLDLFLLRGGWLGSNGRMRNSLLRNDGANGFSDITRPAGLAEPAYPTQSAAFADYDLDGDLDLYIGNEEADDGRAYPSQLFRNEGDGTFVDVAEQAGVLNERMAKGVAWGDYDDDGWPDLYVSNLGANRLYRNQGDGTFDDRAAVAGVIEPSGRSFAVGFLDYDEDGRLDLFVADYSAPLDVVAAGLLGLGVTDGHPRLYRNLGDGSFDDVSREVGLTLPSLPMGTNFADLDGDGWLDLYLGTGTPSFESIAPNLFYRNLNGRGFENQTVATGLGHLQKGHGVAFADVDRDGDLDLFEQMGGAYPGDAFPSALYDNPGSEGRWLELQLEGRRANRSAIGARVRLEIEGDEGRRTLHRVVGSGASFGGNPLSLQVGLGTAERIVSVEIDWPTPAGEPQRVTGLQLDRRYRIVEGQGPTPKR